MSAEPTGPRRAAFAAPWHDLPRNVWVLAAGSFLRDVSSEMLVHLQPLLLANVLGVRTPVIGLVEGVAETTASLSRIYSGWWSDRIGRRKGLTVLGYGLAALSVPLLLAAHTWPVVAASRFLDRLGKGIRTAPRDALIADSIPADRRGASFGIHRAADSAGAAVGLALAGLVVWWMQRGAPTLSADTFRVIAAWAIVPAVGATLVIAALVREAGGPTSAAPPRLSLAGFDRPFRRLLVVVALFTLGNSSDAFLVLRAQSVGVSVVVIMAMIAVFNVVNAALSAPAGALSDRVGRRRILVGGWTLYAVVYLGFALVSRPSALWALYAAYGAYYALTEGTAKALVADVVSPERRGTAYGLYHAVVGLAALPSSVLAGVLWQGVGSWDGLGPSAPFLAGAALAVAAAAMLAGWVR